MQVGRPPKPTHLKVMMGNPGRHPLNKNEAKPTAKIPPCPKHLGEEAKKEWRRMAKKLLSLGLFTEIDGTALAAYCQLYERWAEAEQKVRQFGMIVQVGKGKENGKGYPIVTPYLQVATKALEQMRVFLTEFGLTPASRSRIHAMPPVQKEENPLERFIRKA